MRAVHCGSRRSADPVRSAASRPRSSGGDGQQRATPFRFDGDGTSVVKGQVEPAASLVFRTRLVTLTSIARLMVRQSPPPRSWRGLLEAGGGGGHLQMHRQAHWSAYVGLIEWYFCLSSSSTCLSPCVVLVWHYQWEGRLCRCFHRMS